MKIRNRLLLVVMAVLMLLGVLTSCQKEVTDGDNTQNPGESKNQSDGDNAPTPQYVYTADFKNIASEALKVRNVRGAFWKDGKIIMIARVITGQESYTDEVTGEEHFYDVTEDALLSMNDDGTGLQLLPDYEKPTLPDDVEGGFNIAGLQAGESGNMWEMQDCYINKFEYPEDWDPEAADAEEKKWDYYVGGEEQFIFRKLDSRGNELLRFNTSELNIAESGSEGDEDFGMGDYFYIESFLPDDAGNLYMTASGKVMVVSGEGKLIATLELEDENSWIDSLIKMSDGRVAAYYRTYNEETERSESWFLPIEVTAKAWGEPIEGPDSAYSFYPGGGEYDVYYERSEGFYGYKLDTKESVKIISWLDVDVDSDYVDDVMSTADGRILALSTDYSAEERKVELVTLSQVEASTIPQKTILTYGCMYLDYNIRKQIIAFNKTNEKYRIQVQNYDEYNTDEDTSAGLTKLTVEILAGKVPDILQTSELPIDRFAAKGYLEDLWPYIDADTELGGRDNLVMPVFDAITTEEGKLWQVVGSFAVQTLMGPTELVGTEPGWTFEEFYAAFEQMPEGAAVMNHYFTRENALSLCCAMCLDEMVDWKTGECKFESPEFINILNFAKMFPEKVENDGDYNVSVISSSVGVGNDEYSRLWTGRQMLTQQYISEFTWWREYDVAMHGGTFIGFPTGSGNGSAFSLSSCLAISTTCKDKEGAWEFVRTLLTEDYQKEIWEFPTNREYFDKQVQEAMKPEYYLDENGNKVQSTMSVWAGNEEIGKINYNPSQEEMDKILELIETTERVFDYDVQMYEIIKEQCGAFFAGDKTAEETAKLVQSRVTLYVNEQR